MIRATFVFLVVVAGLSVGVLAQSRRVDQANVDDLSTPRPRSSTARRMKHLNNSAVAQVGTSSTGYTEAIIHSFSGTNGDGIGPNSDLIADGHGNYYGTTAGGGTAGLGTVYRVTPGSQSTSYEALYSVTGNVGPSTLGVVGGGLVLDSAGNLYGTSGGGIGGYGTVFEFTSSGGEILLYSFTGALGDALDPVGSLVLDGAGNLYGSAGGGIYNHFRGTVFKLSPEPLSGCASGSHVGNGYCETLLYNFPGSSGDGEVPNSLVMDGAGNLYGTTLIGGTGNCSGGCGTVFKLDPAGNETVLYSFTGTALGDGNAPEGGLILDSGGNLYGTTVYGGITTGSYCGSTLGGIAAQGCGTVFKLSPQPPSGCVTGSNVGNGYCETVLYSFAGPPLDGEYPYASLLLDNSGNLYGTTGLGGTADAGTVFKLDPTGNETVLYSFMGTNADGSGPGGLLLDSSGNVYGTAGGGAFNDGVVFRLDALPSTTTNLSLSPASVAVDSSLPIVMTAMVSPVSGSGTPTGSVTFFNGTSQIGSASLNAGVATLNYDAIRLVFGTYSIIATYAGDASFGGSTSSPQTLTVTNSLSTTTNLGLSASTVTVGSSGPVVMSATVSKAYGIGTPTGSVTFFDGTSQIGSASLNAGVATFNYNPGNLAVGTYSITASYSGDSSFLGSTSSAQTLSVTAMPTYTLSVNPSSLTIVAGQSGQAAFAVTPQNGFNSQVTFSCSGLPAEANCSFAPSLLTPNGGNPATTTLTITTTAPTAAAWRAASLLPIIFAVLLFPGILAVLGAPQRAQPIRAMRVITLLAAVATMGAGVTSCGSGSSNVGGHRTGGTPVGTSTVIVTASTGGAGSISQTAKLIVTITQ